jgi:hypothetical protein
MFVDATARMAAARKYPQCSADLDGRGRISRHSIGVSDDQTTAAKWNRVSVTPLGPLERLRFSLGDSFF